MALPVLLGKTSPGMTKGFDYKFVRHFFAVITLQPGPIGVWLEPISGEVLDLEDAAGQCARAGVKVGWKLMFIDGVAYTEQALEQQIGGSKSYEAAFRKSFDPIALLTESQHLVKLDKHHSDYQSILNLICLRSANYLNRYGFSLKVLNIHRVGPRGRLEEYEKMSHELKLGEPLRLFHGTCSQNIQKIISDGFDLSVAERGMFGKGVYFADCPLKSIQYSEAGDSSFATRRQDACGDACGVGCCGVCATACGVGCCMLNPCAGAAACIGHCGASVLTCGLASVSSACGGCCGTAVGCAIPRVVPRLEGRVHMMLVCDVFLGRNQTMLAADSNGHLQGFDSGFAPGRSAVQVPEYVVYHQRQAIPRYVIEFKRKLLSEP